MAAAPPEHVEQTIEAIVRLHAEHRARATFSERLVQRITRAISRPVFLLAISAAVMAWILLNVLLPRAWDPPPFNALQGIATLVALYITVLILTTQRREDEIARHRDQLTLQLAILSERKLAKVIELVEELRRDHPDLHDRVDHEAEAMAQSADPHDVLNAIRDIQEAVPGS